MVIFFQGLVLVSIFFLIYTYLIYPMVMKWLTLGKKEDNDTYQFSDTSLPHVMVLMAAHNEEQVISEKIKSLIAQDYPQDKFSIYIGSDQSSDDTNKIISEYAERFNQIKFFPFPDRSGKPETINKLVRIIEEKMPRTNNLVFLMTDASVIMDKDVTYQLVRHFKNENIGLVDANMKYRGMKSDGISQPEDDYISSEVTLKNNEYKITGQMVGPFGGCYALRSTLYPFVPSYHLVDDFYIALHVVDKGAQVRNELNAVCYEPVSHTLTQEYKRKKRISTGNFQNLFAFKNLLNPFSKFGIIYISHKVLRWLGPFWILGIILGSFYLMYQGFLFYKIVFFLMMIWLLAIPLCDFLLSKLRVHIGALRKITYFNYMNLALLHGFFNYLKGVDIAIWDRTERAVD